MAGHGGFLKFKTCPGRCYMVIINSPLKGLIQQLTRFISSSTTVCLGQHAVLAEEAPG